MTFPRKYSPYIFILILCVVIGTFRAIILTEFHWSFHVLAFFGQFIVMSAIWQLVGFVNKKLEKRFSFDESPGIQILLQVLVTIILLSPVLIATYLVIKPFLPKFLDQRYIVLLIIIILMVVFLMTFGYYTYDLFVKNKRSTEEKGKLELEAAKLEKEKSMMRFHHLKNQVNPHFLFNTFTSLDGLIQTNPALASEFVRHLSKVYRYVLEHKENEIVSMETEMNFIEHYISLLQIRYKESIEIVFEISQNATEKGIVMVTLQMLIDNAIKHNIVQSAAPLKIWIWDEGDYLHIHNNKQLRRQIETSNKQGLKQLQELYSFLSERPMEIKETTGSFEIILPLL